MKGRIAPSSAAFLVVAVLIVSGWGLRVWGPINPAISTEVRGAGVLDAAQWEADEPSVVGLDPRLREVTLTVSNHSRSDVTVDRLRVVRSAPAPGVKVTTGPLPTLVSALVSEDARSDGEAAVGADGRVGRTLGAGASMTIRVRVAVAACDTEEVPALDNSARYAVVADLRTASGRIKAVGAEHAVTTSDPTCGLLPPLDEVPGQPRGAEPADPRAARLHIAQAYAVAYDYTQPVDRRTAAVDDARGLPDAVGQAVAGPFGSIALQAGAHVVAVSFTAPDQAVVAYELEVSGNPWRRRGTASLVDGTWRVSRSTICADLALAEVHCPPIP